ncbi:hypothetical protein SAMN05444266_1155 [Chitinophaga jiangningensis]|uniref:Uncharacterized protein n=1 Tax=Chitinophaga jiangningensis TaxID=1419482 RepID=A0A1M7MW13_9BACT|nr:hypothetical protein [Chitinophaga jiangningensis]SHM94790.1 hypothetical protein SAMN05444266_1155 [Chitinophaga jiangningensis]
MEWNHIPTFAIFREKFANLYQEGDDLQGGYQQFVLHREMEIQAAGHFHRVGSDYLLKGSVPFHHQYFGISALAHGQVYCMIRPETADPVMLTISPEKNNYRLSGRYMRLLDNTFTATIGAQMGEVCYQQLQQAITEAIVPATGLKRTTGTRYEIGRPNGQQLEIVVQRNPVEGSPVERIAGMVSLLLNYTQTKEEELLERLHETNPHP